MSNQRTLNYYSSSSRPTLVWQWVSDYVCVDYTAVYQNDKKVNSWT